MEFSNLRVKNIDFVVRHKATLKRWNSSNHHHIIGIKLSGKAYHDFGYKNFTIEKNCIYFLNQKDKYSVEMLEFGEVISVHFTTCEPIDTDSFCIKVNNPEEIIRLIQKIETQKHLSSQGENLLLSIFYNLCNEFDKVRKKSYFTKDKRIENAKQYIDLHFNEENCLKKVVETCGITQRRFGDVFKEHYTVTPNKYIVTRKIEYAKELLKSENLSVSDISSLCGFGDIYYFSKVFKSETGVTPTQYRKSLKNVYNNLK